MNRLAQPPAAMRLAAWAAGFLLMGAAFSSAHAAGTTAGTDVSNTATINYSVGGVAQPQASSNTVTFEVDRRINLTVAEVGADYTDVSPGQQNQLLTFDVTNLSNSPLDFRLTFTQDTTGTASPTGFTPAGTDNFDTANVVFYRDDGDNVFDAGDTVVTFLDEVAADATIRVYVESDIPAGQANASIAGGTLTAISAQSTNGTGAYVATAGSLASDAAETNTGSTDDPAFIDTVFGDTGAADGNTAEDGRALDDDAYYVVAATIVVTKSSTVVNDPFNGTTNPKAIPAAVIEYCLDINNTGAADATTVVLTDAIPANTTYVAGSIKSASTGSGTACNLNSGTVETDDTTLDGAEVDGRTADFNVSTAGAVTIRINSIGASAREKMLFRVTVN
jgi:uncharacterized repeat protein (TIGR01451 family)